MSKKSRRPLRRMPEGAPIRIVGRDPEDSCWLATREGEPSFQGVQDLGDAINASSTRGDVAITMKEQTYHEMHARGDAWFPVPSRVWVD